MKPTKTPKKMLILRGQRRLSGTKLKALNKNRGHQMKHHKKRRNRKTTFDRLKKLARCAREMIELVSFANWLIEQWPAIVMWLDMLK